MLCRRYPEENVGVGGRFGPLVHPAYDKGTQTSLLLADAYSVELQIPVLFQDAVENSVVEPETLEVEAVGFDQEQVEAVETGFGLRVAVQTVGPFAWAELGSNSVGQLEHRQ